MNQVLLSPTQAFCVIVFFIAMIGVLWSLRGLQKDVEQHGKDIADLKEKMKKPGGLPYQTRDELEHAVSALIVLESELTFKHDLLENAMEHIRLARDPKK